MVIFMSTPQSPAPNGPAPNGRAGKELSASIVGVFAGKPEVIGEVRGQPVTSSIAKRPVTEPRADLTTTNLGEDRQADLTVHGGPDKAVYLYPAAHYPAWQAEGFAVEVGGMGENVTLGDLTEHDVRLGDTWRWGTALIQISQPRAPCYKLSLHTGRKDIGPRMIATGRSGWYSRVLEPGTVPAEGAMTLVDRDEDAPTLHQAFTAMFASRRDDGPTPVDADVLDRLLASTTLAEQWRSALAARFTETTG